jgi:hypothetical protein
MILARTAPAGIRGLSLFLVPKILPDGTRNDAYAVGLEHKLGIHASPTCVMQYGDKGGAVAYLVGNENEGIKCMFTMMNNARLSVGLQGVALAERAYQHALAYAQERTQGFKIGDKIGARVKIIEHPDIRRMLLSMRTRIEAGRAMAYEAALTMDLARAGDKKAQAKVDLLTPIVKAWCTDMAVEAASLGIQVHGGMGFIEETGAAQYYRDARILPIYEGTNGIQALDLAGRKVLGDNGKAAKALFAEIDATVAALAADAELTDVKTALSASVAKIRRATSWLLREGAGGHLEEVASVNVPYLEAFGAMLGGAMTAKAALAAAAFAEQGGNPAFCAAKRMTAKFYATHVLPKVSACAETVLKGSQSVTQFQPKFF